MLTVTPQTAGENYEYGRVQAAVVLFVLITTLVGELDGRLVKLYHTLNSSLVHVQMIASPTFY